MQQTKLCSLSLCTQHTGSTHPVSASAWNDMKVSTSEGESLKCHDLTHPKVVRMM